MILDKYHILGVSHHQCPLNQRSSVYLSPDKTELMLKKLKCIKEFSGFVLSTCNRTEIYYHGLRKDEVLDIWSSVIENQINSPIPLYTLSGLDMLEHLMKVCSGADSKILGDREIMGQFRYAVKRSKEIGLFDGVWDKIVNCAISTSRAVQRETIFHKGSISIGYQICRIIRQHASHEKNILIIGAGEMARTVIKYLVKHHKNANIHITNRTHSKAEILAKEFGVNSLIWDRLNRMESSFNIIISAIHSHHPDILIDPDRLNDPAYIFDLGVPRNIAVQNYENGPVSYFDLDLLSDIVEQNAQLRKMELPEVYEIISKEISKFDQWQKKRNRIREVKIA